MNRRMKVRWVALAFAVMALSYLGGTLAPPLISAAVAPAAPDITETQYKALQAAVNLLLGDDEAQSEHLPLIRR